MLIAKNKWGGGKAKGRIDFKWISRDGIWMGLKAVMSRRRQYRLCKRGFYKEISGWKKFLN